MEQGETGLEAGKTAKQSNREEASKQHAQKSRAVHVLKSGLHGVECVGEELEE